MTLILLIAVVLIGAAAALALRAIAIPRLEASDRVAQIQSYGNVPVEQQVAARDSDARLTDLLEWIGRELSGRFGGISEADIRKELIAAGMYNVSPTALLGYRGAGTVLGGALMVLLASAYGAPLVLVLVLAVAGAFAGFMAPTTYVRRKARHRQEEIDYALPELVDLLVVTVEAGIAFSGSLQLATTRFRGPLGDELRLMLREQMLGLSTNQALENLLARCETPSMRAFVRSIVQGESLGVSIGTIMRNLAQEMRQRRRQAAEERAQRAPIKMLFPLVFLIFPALFIVILYPALHSITSGLGS